MKRFAGFLILFIALGTGPALHPQAINYNQYPPGLDWRYIDTAKFRIVFPFKMLHEGQRTANILDHIYPQISTGGRPGKKITLFLPNSGVTSNGYIQLAPWKGEFFTTPPQSGITGNIEWYSALALHEGKHVDQFDRLNTGFTKAGGMIFGDLGRGFLSFLSVPAWFWEGESIHTETVFSSGGRGRLPSFDMGIRSLLLTGRRYGYIKSYLSSYRDHVPDVYRLGYFMTTFLKNNYSPDTLGKILDHSSAYSFYPFIFSRALKRSTGMNTNQLYEKVMNGLRDEWGTREKKLHLTGFTKVKHPEKTGWTLFTSPKFAGNGDIVVQKYGLAHPLTLVRITPAGKEIRVTGMQPVDHSGNALSVSGRKAVWSETVTDLRWGKRSYSVIVLCDILTGKKTRLTGRTRYFSPALSPDGKHIAAVRFSGERRSALLVLDSGDGSVIGAFDPPGNSLLITPAWDQTGKRITMIRMTGGKKTISIFDLAGESFTDILPLSFDPISTPVFYGDYILYNSSYSGTDNIHGVKILTGEQYMITSSRFGAFSPTVSADGKTILYSDYNYNGTDMVTIPAEPQRWVPVSEVAVERTDYFAQNSGALPITDLTDPALVPRKEYPVKKYRKLKDLINFHSRALIPDRTEPAFEIYSANKLNNTFITAGISYNTNEQTGKIYTEAVYAGWFPVLKAAVSRNGRHITAPAELEWNETTASFSIQIPLNLSGGIFTRRADVMGGISDIYISGSPDNNGYRINPGHIRTLDFAFKYANYPHRSKRDLSPATGQFLSAEYSFTPGDTYYRGSIFSVQGTLLFPGLFRHNSLRAAVSFERQNPRNYVFSGNIPHSWGYEARFWNNLLFASLDYTFPIAYPDLVIGDLFYLKRIKGGFFIDMGRGYDKENSASLHSAGLELRGDVHLFSIPVDLDIGVRMIYRFADHSFRFDAVFLGLGF